MRCIVLKSIGFFCYYYITRSVTLKDHHLHDEFVIMQALKLTILALVCLNGKTFGIVRRYNQLFERNFGGLCA